MKHLNKTFSKLLVCCMLVVSAGIIKTDAQPCSGSWASTNHLDYDCVSGEWIAPLSIEPAGCPINPVYLPDESNTFTFSSPVSAFSIDFNAFSTGPGCARMEIKINGVFYHLTAANLSSLTTSGGIPCMGFNAVLVTSDGYITSDATSTMFTNAQGKISITGVNATSVTVSTNDPAGSVLTSPYNCINVVPLKLNSFTATQTADCKATLHWETGIESNIKRIEILRSEDGINFTKVAETLSKGSNSTYIMVTDNENDAYFRLKINDLDGNAEYSEIRTLRSACSKTIYQVSPNPAHDLVTIRGLKHDDRLSVLDMFGRNVLSFEASHSNNYNIQQLTPGMYFLQVKNNGMIKANLKVIKR